MKRVYAKWATQQNFSGILLGNFSILLQYHQNNTNTITIPFAVISVDSVMVLFITLNQHKDKIFDNIFNRISITWLSMKPYETTLKCSYAYKRYPKRSNWNQVRVHSQISYIIPKIFFFFKSSFSSSSTYFAWKCSKMFVKDTFKNSNWNFSKNNPRY